MTVLRSVLLFALAALAEIGGAWLIWQGAREHADAQPVQRLDTKGSGFVITTSVLTSPLHAHRERPLTVGLLLAAAHHIPDGSPPSTDSPRDQLESAGKLGVVGEEGEEHVVECGERVFRRDWLVFKQLFEKRPRGLPLPRTRTPQSVGQRWADTSQAVPSITTPWGPVYGA